MLAERLQTIGIFLSCFSGLIGLVFTIAAIVKLIAQRTKKELLVKNVILVFIALASIPICYVLSLLIIWVLGSF
ncbi:MAG: hypothetical protein WCJ58_06760 [bacterium]